MAVIVVIAYYRLNSPTLAQWDEAVYAVMAKKILATKDLLSINDYWPYDKPQVFFWITALLYKIIGVNEVAVRAISATSLGATVLITAGWMSSVFKKPAWGALAALLLIMCPYYVFVGRHGQMDMPLTLGIMLSLWGVYRGVNRPRYYFVFGLGLMIAILSKQVVSLAFIGIITALWLSWSRNWPKIMNRYFFLSLFSALLIPTVIWYVPMYCRYGGEFLNTHFIYHVFRRSTEALEGNSGSIWFYGLHLIGENKALSGLYLASAVYGLITAFNTRHQYRSLCQLTSLWILVIMVIISLSQTKLETYIVPIMPALVINAVVLIKQSPIDKIARWLIASGVVATIIYLSLHSWWLAGGMAVILIIYLLANRVGWQHLIIMIWLVSVIGYNLPFWSTQWLWRLRPEDEEAYQYTQHLSPLSAGNEDNIIIDFYK